MLDTETAIVMVEEEMQKKFGDFEFKVEWLDEYDTEGLYEVSFKMDGKKYIGECNKENGEVRIIKL